MKLSVPVFCRRLGLFLVLGALLPGFFAFAEETLYLKSGEKFVGTVLEETPAGVKIQVRSGTIKETKFFAKDLVDRIERPTPDDLAVKALQAKLPTPSLLDLAGYKRLTDSAEEFLKEFPESKHRAEVQKILDELKAESDKVAAGAVKLNGEWISAEERKAHQENVDASILLARIQQMARSGAYVPALRGLDALRTQYPKTKAYAESLAVAPELIKAYGRFLVQKQQDRKVYDAEYEQRKDRLTPQEVQQAEGERAQRAAQVVALNAKEKTAGVKWRSVNLESLEDIGDEIEFVRKELAALDRIKVDDIKADANALYEAETLLAQGQLEEAETKLREAVRAKTKYVSSKDPHIVRIAGAIKQVKDERVAAAKLAEIEKAKAEAAVKPIITSGDGKVTAEDALDALMAERPAKGKAGQEVDTKTTGKAKPATKAKAAKGEDAEEGDELAAKPKKTVPAVTASADEGGGLSLPTIMGGVLILLLIITGVVYFLQNKKAAAGGGGGGEE